MQTNKEIQPDPPISWSVRFSLPPTVITVPVDAASGLTVSHPYIVSPVCPSIAVVVLQSGAHLQKPPSSPPTTAIASAPRPFPLARSFASSVGLPALPVALSMMQVAPTTRQPPISKNQVLCWDHMVSVAIPTVSPPTEGVSSLGTAVQLSAFPSVRPDCPPNLPT